MTIEGSTEEWKAWTGLEFPDDGGYLVPGDLVPVRRRERPRLVRRAQSLDAPPVS
jgi:hypothetical protein